MTEKDKKKLSPLGLRMAERFKDLGKGVPDIMRACNITQPAVSQIMSRGTTKYIHKIAEELKTTPKWLEEEIGLKSIEIKQKQKYLPSQRESSLSHSLSVQDTIPLYGPASAGISNIYITEECVIGEEPRPPGLQNVKGGFMMLVTGDCMEPRIMHGEKVWVHPYRVPVLNDDCVLVMEPEGNAEIKRFLGENKEEYKFMQLNPPAKFNVQKKNVRNLFTVIGYSRY